MDDYYSMKKLQLLFIVALIPNLLAMKYPFRMFVLFEFPYRYKFRNSVCRKTLGEIRA